jgi:phosphomannomutase
MTEVVKMPESLMMSVSGVRGIVGRDMNPEVATRFTVAFTTFLEGDTVVVGRDTRPSGVYLSRAVITTLQFCGFDVIELGIAATPTVEIMVRETGAAGGVIVTASHNGPEWNALKLLDNRGEFLDRDSMNVVIEKATGEEFLFGEVERYGEVEANHSADRVHIDRIMGLELIDPSEISSAGFKAAIDCVNGAGSRIGPALLRDLGVEVIELFTDVDSPFPHVPEPRPENLSAISEAVVENSADIGFAFDPDGDRLVLVNERGEVCSEELTLALATDCVLKSVKGPVVANMSSSRYIDYIAGKYGVEVYRSEVGEANVTAKMKSVEAVVGGEGNGGVIYPPFHYGRDALTGMAIILQLLTDEKVSLGRMVSRLPEYSILKRKISFDGDLTNYYAEIKNAFDGKIIDLDGIRIDMEEGWVHIRKSNTEPVVRIIAESVTQRHAQDMVDTVIGLLSGSK